MSALEKIACLQGRRDEELNHKLARELAETGDKQGIEEIAQNIFNKDKNIAGDCLKVLYEAGYSKPALTADYWESFLQLLGSKNNRLVWGAMIALSTIAQLRADELFNNIDSIYAAMDKGSVITVDNGIKVLAAVAVQKEEYAAKIFPYLLDHLKNCRAKEIPQHAESILAAADASFRDDFISVLRSRESELSDTQLKRIKKVYRALG